MSLKDLFTNPAPWILMGASIGAIVYFILYRRLPANFLTNPATWVFIGALIGAIGSMSASIQQDIDSDNQKKSLVDMRDDIIKRQKDLNNKNEEIKLNLEKVNSSALTQVEYQKKISSKSDEISQLQKELRAKSEEIAQSITGGNSYCFALIFGNNSSESVDIVAVHKGEFPLYSLNVSVIDDDIKTVSYKEGMSVSDFVRQQDKLQVNFNIGDMAKGSGRRIGALDADKYKEKTYKLYFSALNGSWVQKIKLAFDKNGYVAFATIIYKSVVINGKIKYLMIDEMQQKEYPKSKNDLKWKFD